MCQSQHKGLIEELALKNFTPEKIYEELHNLKDPKDIAIVDAEGIKPTSIRRHLQRHFNRTEDILVNDARIKSNITSARNKLKEGKKINIDKANTLSYLIDIALTHIEEVESMKDNKKHQYTIQYMGQIKSLIDELNKVSGAIKQEGTIDSNFYRTQIDTMAKIVLSTIRALDQQYNMNYELETAFAEEFKKQFALFKAREDMIFAGKLSPTDGEEERSINTFNDSSSLV